jgi:hypothetical protein
MPVTVRFGNKPGSFTLKFHTLNEAGEYLRSDGIFEAFNPVNALSYRTLLSDSATGNNGEYVGTIPTILAAHLPTRVTVYVIDTNTMATDGPIGQGSCYIDNNNNEQNDPKLLNNIFASTVGNNLGVGTSQESYYGADNVLAFTSIFDTNGNRQVTVE